MLLSPNACSGSFIPMQRLFRLRQRCVRDLADADALYRGRGSPWGKQRGRRGGSLQAARSGLPDGATSDRLTRVTGSILNPADHASDQCANPLENDFATSVTIRPTGVRVQAPSQFDIINNLVIYFGIFYPMFGSLWHKKSPHRINLPERKMKKQPL